jgi:hypothetical protein
MPFLLFVSSLFVFYPSNIFSVFLMPTSFPSYIIQFVFVNFEEMAEDLKPLGFYLRTI